MIDLTPAQQHAVEHLASHGAMAESLCTSTAAGTIWWGTVNELFELGLARRTGLDQHGRLLVELTDTGRQVAA